MLAGCAAEEGASTAAIPAAAAAVLVDAGSASAIAGPAAGSRAAIATQGAAFAELDADARDRLSAVSEVFHHYADRYCVDPLLTLAQGYTESRFSHAARSRSGAVGIMQVLPATALELGFADVHDLEANVHAGTLYLRRLFDRYRDEPDIGLLDRVLFAVAAYNAGPGRVAALRRTAAAQGLDPNVWFDHVERVARGRQATRETVRYVANTLHAYRALQEVAAADTVAMTRAASPEAHC